MKIYLTYKAVLSMIYIMIMHGDGNVEMSRELINLVGRRNDLSGFVCRFYFWYSNFIKSL